MNGKILKIIFVILFFGMILLPLAKTNLEPEKVSESENRKLAAPAKLYDENGDFNTNFTSDFETWINDNIGFRSELVIQNAKMQYYMFHVLANNTDMYLGPNGEINYATSAMLLDYQHNNYYSEDELKEITAGYQKYKDYVEEKGAQFYYYQCWDKHSIYPEQFPDTVYQYGDLSKTDLVNQAILEDTDVCLISPKEELIAAKKDYQTYSVAGDPTHWTQRGAYIGYLKLMNTLNQYAEKPYKVLQEEDYDIATVDQGTTLFGGIHRIELLENFQIKNPAAVLTNEKLTLYSEDQRHRFFTNDRVDNDTRLLIIGDSYFDSFLLDDLAESFHEVLIIWGDYLGDFQHVVDEYDADIVIVEAAERVDRSMVIANGASNINP